MLHRCLGFLEGTLSFAFLPIQHACAIVLRSLGIQGVCSPEDIKKYQEFKKQSIQSDGGIIVFNHSTPYDHLVMMYELRDRINFMLPDPHVLGSWPPWLLPHRKPALLAYGGYSPDAFRSNVPILPIVLIYSHPPSRSILQRLLTPKTCTYTMQVLDPVYPPDKNSDPNAIAKETAYRMDKAQIVAPQITVAHNPLLTGTIGCLAASHLFMLCGIAALSRRLYVYGIGMFMVFVTSWLYHGTNDAVLRAIDIKSNVFWIGICGSMLIRDKNYLAVLSLIFAGISYMLDLDHALFVHVPVAIAMGMVRPTPKN